MDSMACLRTDLCKYQALLVSVIRSYLIINNPHLRAINFVSHEKEHTVGQVLIDFQFKRELLSLQKAVLRYSGSQQSNLLR